METYTVLKRIYKQPRNTYFEGTASDKRPVLIRKAYLPRSWKQVFNSKQVALLKSNLHPVLGSLLEILKENNKFFFVYEPVDQNLLPFVRSPQLPLQRRIDIFRQLLGLFRILACKQGLSFRQVRTDSLFMRAQNPVIVQLDGILGESQQSIDFCYSAPEVLVNKTCNKSVVFSLGCIAFEVLTGEVLLTCQNQIEYMYQLCALFPDYFKPGKQEFGQKDNFTYRTQHLPAHLIKTLRSMLQHDSSKRADLDTLSLDEQTLLSPARQVSFPTRKPAPQYGSSQKQRKRKEMPLDEGNDTDMRMADQMELWVPRLGSEESVIQALKGEPDLAKDDKSGLRIFEIDSRLDDQQLELIKQPVSPDFSPEAKAKSSKKPLKSSESVDIQDSFNYYRPVIPLISRPIAAQQNVTDFAYNGNPRKPAQKNISRPAEQVEQKIIKLIYKGARNEEEGQMTNYARQQHLIQVSVGQINFKTEQDQDF